MSYTKKDIPQMIVALEACKNHLAMKESDNTLLPGSKTTYICYALSTARKGAWTEAQDMVMDALGLEITFRGWLDSKRLYPRLTFAQLQKLRLQWIDKMIADLKEYAR